MKMAVTFEHCDKFTGPIKEVLDYLRDYQLLKGNSVL
jgi:hypothetical protein